MVEELPKAAKIAVEECLDIKEGEQVLIVVDEPKREIGRVIFEAAKELGAEVMLMEMLPRDNHGQEPPELIAKAMKNADVVIMPTSKSLSHTKARIEANKAGARATTMPDITEDMMKRALNANYNIIRERGSKVGEILSRGKEVRVTAPNGTDIKMVIEGRDGYPDTGIYHNPGEFGNLPAGEAYIAPVEGKTEGKFVVDGSMAEAEVHTETIELIVKRGYVTEIKGNNAARRLEEMIKPYGKDALNIAELGIGTNDKARLTGNILEDEKVLGTVHIAIGDNSGMGGVVSVDSHLDGIIEAPTVEVDGEIIMKNGNLLV